MSENKGCCGHPQTCTNTGRCKAYEDFLEVSQPKPERKSWGQEIADGMSDEVRKSIREKIRKRRERKALREASRPKRRGDTGRTMER